MRTPALSTSLADFWGGRWNTGFHQLAVGIVFKPLRSRLGPAGAMLAVFLVSGLVHDLVISFPAGVGFGLPTAYFLLQAAGLTLERSAYGKALGLGRGTLGWLFTLIIAAGPAFWLFHPWFVMGVVLPFLKVIRAA
jgi:alginate O-acetyltransferase complex protein AlgI